MSGTQRSGLRQRWAATVQTRLSPEGTRRATLLERHTVARLTWERLVWVNRNLEIVGKLTTAVWIGFIASLVLGADWQGLLERTINSGRPVVGAFLFVVTISTLVFVAARSSIGFIRWRVQRELWRREVARR